MSKGAIVLEPEGKLEVLELFAGIGAFSEALNQLGIKHRIVDAVENDKFAVASFNAIHGTNFEPQDIREYDPDLYCSRCHRLFNSNWLQGSWTTGGESKCQFCHGGMEEGVSLEPAKEHVDVIMHGSPCQDFSVAGKQAGGDEGSGTRSSLMYETLRIVEKLRPPIVIWENVKNLLSKKHRHNFDAYLKKMEELGYKNHYKVLNAKDYGVPQNRERVFTVSLLSGDFEFPEPIPLTTKLKDILEDKVDEKYYLSDEQVKNYTQRPSTDISKTIRGGGRGSVDRHSWDLAQVGNLYPKSGNPQAGRVYDAKGISPAMDTCSGGNRMPKIIQRARGKNKGYELELSPTISASKWQDNNVLKEPVIAAMGTGGGNVPLVKSFIGKHYDNFIKKKGYTPELFNPYHEKELEDVAPTQTSNCSNATSSAAVMKYDGVRIRKLTPKECWRLMGFSDTAFDRAAKVNSNTQLYKQAGNSIVVDVLKRIIINLIGESNE